MSPCHLVLQPELPSLHGNEGAGGHGHAGLDLRPRHRVGHQQRAARGDPEPGISIIGLWSLELETKVHTKVEKAPTNYGSFYCFHI